MVKSKKRNLSKQPNETSSGSGENVGVSQSATAPRSSEASLGQLQDSGVVQPSKLTRRFVSAGIVVHLSACIVTLSGNLAPSYLHGQFATWLSPYQVVTGQDYNLLPLELTHGSSIDTPLELEIQIASISKSDSREWQRVELPSTKTIDDDSTLGNPGSRWGNIARLMLWIVNDEPDSEILAEITANLVRHLEATRTNQTIAAIRLVQPPVLSFDEDLLIYGGQAEFLADSFESKVVYSAKVVRLPDGEIGILPEQSTELTSKPVAASDVSESPQSEPRVQEVSP